MNALIFSVLFQTIARFRFTSLQSRHAYLLSLRLRQARDQPGVSHCVPSPPIINCFGEQTEVHIIIRHLFPLKLKIGL